MSTLRELSTEASQMIVAKMTKNQAFSIKTIHGWIDAKYQIRIGRKGVDLLTLSAVEEARNAGLIVRRNGKYAPGVTEGWMLTPVGSPAK